LLNTYAVVYPGENLKAAAFAKWLTAGRGRDLIDNYRISGRKAFEVWPVGCPGTRPASPVCAGRWSSAW